MARCGKNRHYRLVEMKSRHWLALADGCGAAGTRQAMLALAQGVGPILDQVEAGLPPDFPAALWQAVSQGVLRQARLFLSMEKG